VHFGLEEVVDSIQNAYPAVDVFKTSLHCQRGSFRRSSKYDNDGSHTDDNGQDSIDTQKETIDVVEICSLGESGKFNKDGTNTTNQPRINPEAFRTMGRLRGWSRGMALTRHGKTVTHPFLLAWRPNRVPTTQRGTGVKDQGQFDNHQGDRS
jgi:hypothetical protein